MPEAEPFGIVPSKGEVFGSLVERSLNFEGEDHGHRFKLSKVAQFDNHSSQKSSNEHSQENKGLHRGSAQEFVRTGTAGTVLHQDNMMLITVQGSSPVRRTTGDPGSKHTTPHHSRPMSQEVHSNTK